MGLYHMGPPARLVHLLKHKLDIDLFLETGTYMGNTSAWASAHFKQVITIEASALYAEKARTRFAGTNVRVVEGSSAAMLARALAASSGAALFWLDAHWCGGLTAGEVSECPFFDEMNVLNARAANDVILLDDARLFLAPPPAPHRPSQWPSLVETISKLENNGARYVVMMDDIFIAIPSRYKDFMIELCQRELGRRARRTFWAAKISRLLGVPW